MTRDDIIRMAQQARLDSIAILSEHWIGLKHFAVLVAAAEREACADLCDAWGSEVDGADCARNIRSRSNNEM